MRNLIQPFLHFFKLLIQVLCYFFRMFQFMNGVFLFEYPP